MKNFKEKFKNPDRQYGIYPIVHARIAETMGVDDVSEFLAEYKKRGFAGVVANTPYTDRANYPNSQSEWEATEKGFRECFKQGMKAWIYDEKGYPSGTAGGSVIEKNPQHPEYQAVGLYCYEYLRKPFGPSVFRSDIPEGKFEYAVLIPGDGSEVIDVSDSINENGTLYIDVPKGSYRLLIMCSRRLFDGTHAAEGFSEPRNYVNLMDKGATKEFIKNTHEKYKEILSDEFSKGVVAFFTDEPSLISWNIRNGVYPILPWHKDFPADFENRYGYSLVKALAAVAGNYGPEKIKRRCDFWDFVADKVADNYFGVIQDWCHKNNTLSSGHMLREESLQCHIYCYGSFYRSAKRFDIPGIDQLICDPSRLMSGEGIPIARFIASFADVYGNGEAFSEASAFEENGSHKQIGVKWLKNSVNWHMAMGVNNLVSYFIFDDFTDEETNEVNLYTARVGHVVRQGKRYSRTAMLYPESSMWAAYTPSIEFGAEDSSPEISLVQKTFNKASWDLLRRQVDFDYIDEKLIEDSKIEDGVFSWNGRRYECLILPACNVLGTKTIHKLIEMLDAGINVIMLGDIPKFSRDTGSSDGIFELFAPYLSNKNLTIISTATDWNFPSRFKSKAIPRTITLTESSPKVYADGEPIAEYVLAQTRILENGDLIVFVANMDGRPYKGNISVENMISAEILNTENGSIEPAEVEVEGNIGTTEIELNPHKSVAFYVKTAK